MLKVIVFTKNNNNNKSVHIIKEIVNPKEELIRWDYLEKLYKIESKKD